MTLNTASEGKALMVAFNSRRAMSSREFPGSGYKSSGSSSEADISLGNIENEHHA